MPHAPGEAVGRALHRRTSSTSASLHRFSGPLRGPSQYAPTLNQPNNYDDDGQHDENVDEPLMVVPDMSPMAHKISSITAMVHNM